jgi:mRNA interferase RelE/StbE
LSYEVSIVRSAEKEMNRLPGTVHTRLSKRILSLEDNPRPRGVRKLSGREEYRLRVGDYRILYTIDDRNHIVTILAVGHRREVYG